MSNNIANIVFDTTIDPDDYGVGTDALTGKTYSYKFRDLLSQLGSLLLSTVSVREITITETVTEDFLELINEDATGIIVERAEVALIKVLDQADAFKALYILHKINVSGDVTYGLNQTQLALSDLSLLQDVQSLGEFNDGANVGSGAELYKGKNGTDIEIKTIVEGDNITITEETDTITINAENPIGEVNDGAQLGSGANVFKDKNTTTKALNFRSLIINGATVTEGANEITIDIWSKRSEAATVTMDISWHNNTVWVKNGASNIEITIPPDLDLKFGCGIYQHGTGDVKLVTGAGVSILGPNNALAGQYGTVWLENDPADENVYLLAGDAKFIA